jgi:hypothetical protein
MPAYPSDEVEGQMDKVRGQSFTSQFTAKLIVIFINAATSTEKNPFSQKT